MGTLRIEPGKEPRYNGEERRRPRKDGRTQIGRAEIGERESRKREYPKERKREQGGRNQAQEKRDRSEGYRFPVRLWT